MIASKCINPQQVDDIDYMAYLDGAGRPEFVQHLQKCQYCTSEVAAYAESEADLRRNLKLTKAPFRVNCPDSVIIGEYTLGLLTGTARRNFENHLAGCTYCTQEQQELVAWSADTQTELDKSQDIKKWLGRVVATVLSITQPMPGLAGAGLRGDVKTFPVTYEAEGVTVNVSVQNAGVQRSDLQVLGFVFADDENVGLNAEGAQVRLIHDGEVLATETIDELGNFFFDKVNPVRFDLEIELKDRVVLIPDLHQSDK